MSNDKFLEICKNVIKPLLDHFANDDHIRVIYDISEEAKALNVKSYYERIRDDIKKDFMQQPDGRIDRHKICACIYAAIATKRPLLKVANDGTLEKDTLVNAKAALLASCKILSNFILDDAKSDPGFKLFLKNNKTLCFPECKNSDSSDTYLTQTLKELCYAQKRNELSVLMLANIFSTIESFTESAYKNTLAVLPASSP